MAATAASSSAPNAFDWPLAYEAERLSRDHRRGESAEMQAVPAQTA